MSAVDDPTRAALGMKFRAAKVAMLEVEDSLRHLECLGAATYVEALSRLLDECFEIDEDGVWLART